MTDRYLVLYTTYGRDRNECVETQTDYDWFEDIEGVKNFVKEQSQHFQRMLAAFDVTLPKDMADVTVHHLCDLGATIVDHVFEIHNDESSEFLTDLIETYQNFCYDEMWARQYDIIKETPDTKTDSPEYQEFLRLRKKFEGR